MLATGGLYAPTIRYYNGTVYIVCTNIIHPGNSTEDITQNFIVSTNNIWSNEWSDPIYFDFHGIDPSIFLDDDGRAYIQGSASPGPMTKIHLFEIDLKTGEKLSEEKKIWDGTGGIYPEGPHIYKKDGWYYLMISEGGTHEGHMITVARSRDIWGSYEAFERNPILTTKGTDEYIRYTGHCDMFEDQQGKWWAGCLGVRKDKEGRFVMGRETFLTTGEWLEGDWPKLNQVKMNQVLPDGKELVRLEGTLPLTADPMVDYLYIRDLILGIHQISNAGKTLTLTASKADMSQWAEPVTFIGKRQRQLRGSSTVTMHKPTLSTNANFKAGLAYYKDEHRYIKLYYDFSVSAMTFELANNAKSISKTARHQVEMKDVVVLRVEYAESSYHFSYQIEEGPIVWASFDLVDSIDVTGPDFVGPVIGVFATAETEGIQVRFEDLKVD